MINVSSYFSVSLLGRSNMEAYKSLTTLQYFLKIFSLHHISNTKPGIISNLGSYIKVALILFVFGYLTSYNLYLHFAHYMKISLSPSVIVIDAVACALTYFEYIVDLCYTYKYRIQMYAYYYNFDQIDTVFKMKYNEDIKQSVITLLAILLTSLFIASLGEICVWASSGGWAATVSYSVSYFIFLIRLLIALDFIFQTKHVRLRLKSIANHIKECASIAEDSACRIKTVRNVTVKHVKVLPVISKCRCEIAKSSSCYLLLIDQTKFLNGFFGVRVLLHCLYTLIEMIMFVNIVARAITGSMSTVVTSYVLLAPNILRIINCVSVLTIMVYHCEACCRQSGDIIDTIDHYLVNKKTSAELVTSLKTLRKLITSRPLKFSAAGFFNMESTLLLSLVSVVITYALILVQSTQ